MDAPDFMILSEGMLHKIACSSLSDEETQARMGPSGARYGWQIDEDDESPRVPCADNPDTHRHILFAY